MVKINDKGLTLLEVLITLAILAVITVSFFSLFTTTNLNINFSSRKVESVREGKSILDEINSEVTDAQIENDQDFKGIVEEILNKKGYHNNYKIFDNDNDFFKYENKKIHCLIERQNIYIESTDNSSIRSNVQKIKIILFYDKGRKMYSFQPMSQLRKIEMYKKLLEKKGLTLVELIITVAILGIIISFMYTFFYFNYDTLLRTGTRYEIQSNLNQGIKTMEDELRYADEIYIYGKKDEGDFDNNKNYIYIKDNGVKIIKAANEQKIFSANNIEIYESESDFKLENNLITIDIKGKYIPTDEEFNIKYTIELLNIKGNNDLKGSIIEYINIKGDDSH